MSDQPRPARPALALIGSALLTVPGVLLRLSGLHPPHWLAALLFGLAIVGAAFLLGWGAEAVQVDISAGLALALLALIAVLPEYAVDFVFTAKAGKNPEEFAPLALANMTGANQLLIGVGWSLVVLLAAYRIGRAARANPGDARLQPVARPATGRTPTDVVLSRTHSVEVAFLMVATLYGLTLPLRHTISLLDAAVLVGIFVAYLTRVAHAPAEEPALVGTAEFIADRPQRQRRIAVVCMFVGAATVILLCAEPFAESLVLSGKEFGISTFLLVKWVAPLASEAPELLIAGMFAWRLNTNAGLGALVSSKVNQWTLLVGTLPIVFAISSRSFHGLPLDALAGTRGVVRHRGAVRVRSRDPCQPQHQRPRGETAARVVPRAVHFDRRASGGWRGPAHITVGIVYLVLAGLQLVRERRQVPILLHDGLRAPYSELVGNPDG